jgi:diguanylate cyclase (GGDEF)-like protein
LSIPCLDVAADTFVPAAAAQNGGRTSMRLKSAVRQKSSAPGSIKRLGYVFGLGGAVIALLLAFPMELGSSASRSFDTVALPMTAGILLVLLVAFLRAKEGVRRLEYLTFLVLATFFLLKMAVALYGVPGGEGGTNDSLGEFGFWFPTLYASILFILGVDKGWRIAIGHFGLTLLIGLPYVFARLAAGTDVAVVYSLSQLYLSSAVAIATVIVFVRYTESMVRAKSEMEHLAHTDFVTELGNRRKMERLLLQEVRRAERYGTSLSLLLLDLDNFKRVNDMYGHPVGDEVLREVSALLLAESRSSDHIGRWGGEEFIMILPHTPCDAARELAERIVSRVSRHGFARVGTVTVSAGGACLLLGEQCEGLVERADAALYRAKEAGRNTVVVSEMLEPRTPA